MPLNVIKFFNPSRLFHMRPSIDEGTIYFLLIVFGALIIAAIIVKIIQSVKKQEQFLNKLYSKYFYCLLVMGVLGEIAVWFRIERVNILSARYWLLIWFVGLVIWLYYVLKYQFKVVPKAREQLTQRQTFDQYLPKKK